MDRSLDEIIGERPQRDTRRAPPTGPRGRGAPPPRDRHREEYPRDGVRKTAVNRPASRHSMTSNERSATAEDTGKRFVADRGLIANRINAMSAQTSTREPAKIPNTSNSGTRLTCSSDWVHDRFEDDRYDRMHRRPPVDDRFEPSRPSEALRSTGTKLRVDNIHYDITEEDIRSLFNRKGPLVSVKLLYDRQDRSEGTAFVTYEDPRDARDALKDYDGQNASGQPIRITLMPTAPAAISAPTGPKPGLSMFDRIQRPERSMFDRIDSRALRNDSRDDTIGRRRERSDSPRRSKPAPEHIDRYVPGHSSRSPIRRRGTPREPGRRPGARREDGGRGGGRRGGRGDGEGRPTGGRPRKTAEELDAEMADYWGNKSEEKSNGAAAAGQNGAAATEDEDMVL
ncbi:hypothetical protein LTR17_024439 [Elasticomyces elasticus]|nr:hypothetical protein LTR17_024439 [Elasticomyces elasticus]